MSIVVYCNLNFRNEFSLKRRQKIPLWFFAVIGTAMPSLAHGEPLFQYLKSTISNQPYVWQSKVPGGQNTVLATRESLGGGLELGLKIKKFRPFIGYAFNKSTFEQPANSTVICDNSVRHSLDTGLNFTFLIFDFRLGLGAGQEYFLRTPRSSTLIIDSVWTPKAFSAIDLPIRIIDDPMSDLNLTVGLKAKAAAIIARNTSNITSRHGESYAAGVFLRVNWLEFETTYSKQRQETSTASHNKTMVEMSASLRFVFN